MRERVPHAKNHSGGLRDVTLELQQIGVDRADREGAGASSQFAQQWPVTIHGYHLVAASSQWYGMHSKAGAEIDCNTRPVGVQTDGFKFSICPDHRRVDVTDHPRINRAKEPFVMITDGAYQGGPRKTEGVWRTCAIPCATTGADRWYGEFTRALRQRCSVRCKRGMFTGTRPSAGLRHSPWSRAASANRQGRESVACCGPGARTRTPNGRR